MLDTSDIPFMALTDVAAGIRSGELSPVTLTETMLARIAAVDPELHSFLSVTGETALGFLLQVLARTGDRVERGQP